MHRATKKRFIITAIIFGSGFFQACNQSATANETQEPVPTSTTPPGVGSELIENSATLSYSELQEPVLVPDTTKITLLSDTLLLAQSSWEICSNSGEYVVESFSDTVFIQRNNHSLTMWSSWSCKADEFKLPENGKWKEEFLLYKGKAPISGKEELFETCESIDNYSPNGGIYINEHELIKYQSLCFMDLLETKDCADSIKCTKRSFQAIDCATGIFSNQEKTAQLSLQNVNLQSNEISLQLASRNSTCQVSYQFGIQGYSQEFCKNWYRNWERFGDITETLMSYIYSQHPDPQTMNDFSQCLSENDLTFADFLN